MVPQLRKLAKHPRILIFMCKIVYCHRRQLVTRIVVIIISARIGTRAETAELHGKIDGRIVFLAVFLPVRHHFVQFCGRWRKLHIVEIHLAVAQIHRFLLITKTSHLQAACRARHGKFKQAAVVGERASAFAEQSYRGVRQRLSRNGIAHHSAHKVGVARLPESRCRHKRRNTHY